MRRLVSSLLCLLDVTAGSTHLTFSPTSAPYAHGSRKGLRDSALSSRPSISSPPFSFARASGHSTQAPRLIQERPRRSLGRVFEGVTHHLS